MEIVTSCFSEDLDWLRRAPFPVHVVAKEGANHPGDGFASLDQIPNAGMEASSYLRFIIREYERLPERMAFVHGHETAPHQRLPVLEAIQRYGHLPFADLNRFVNVHLLTSRGAELPYRELWRDTFGDALGSMPECINFRLGAQFVVARELVASRPRRFYERMYERVASPKKPFGSSAYWNAKGPAIFAENCWHLVFGADSPIEPKPRPYLLPDQADEALRLHETPEGWDPLDYADLFVDMDMNCLRPGEFHEAQLCAVRRRLVLCRLPKRPLTNQNGFATVGDKSTHQGKT